jgi:hypothetical protein
VHALSTHWRLDYVFVLSSYGGVCTLPTSVACALCGVQVEGAEYAILHALAEAPELVCRIDYIFTEYHNLKVNMTKYGFPEAEKLGAYQRINGRITQLMDSVPHCRLKILWRSFWSTCGEGMRMGWTASSQATGRAEGDAPPKAKPKRGRKRGRRRGIRLKMT